VAFVLIKKTNIIILIGIILAGAALRVAYLSELYDEPIFRHPEIDALYHNYWAKGLVSGNWAPPLDHDYPAIQENAYFKPPGTPYFLAFVYMLFGISNLYPRIIFMILGILSCFFMYFFVRELFDELTGKIATFIFATYWAFIYYEATFLEPTLAVFFNVLVIFLIFRWISSGGLWKFILSAVIAGFCVLTRPNVLLCIPVIGLFFVYWEWKKQKNFFRGIATGFLWCFFVGVTILPVTIRNYVVSGEFVPINTQAGITLYTGNNPHANGYIATTPEIGGWTCFDWPRIVDDTNKRIGKELTQAETDKYYAKRALDYIKKHPYHTFQLMVKKFFLFWGPKEVCNQKEAECDIRESAVLRVLPLRFSHLLSFAILGLIMWLTSVWKNRKNNLNVRCTSKPTQATIWLVIFFTLVYSATFIPFQVAGRYRVPIIPFLIIGASYSISYFFKLFIFKKFIQIILWLSFLLLIWFVTSYNFAGYKPRVGRWHLFRGASYLLDENYEKALEDFRYAEQLRPNDERVCVNIGVALYRTGNIDMANKYFKKALNINPKFYRTLQNLGLLKVKTGNLDEAYHYFQQAFKQHPSYFVACELGRISKELGNTSNAIYYFNVALKQRPEDKQTHVRLGAIYADLHRFMLARSHLEIAINIGATSPEIYLACSKLCMELGDTNSAIVNLEKAVKQNPNNIQIRYNLAQLYSQIKHWKKAAEMYNNIIQENLSYPPLLNNYAWLLATSPDKNVRNGNLALKLASQICELTQWKNLPFIDTLAAAYAEMGDYSNSIALLEEYQNLATNSEMKQLVEKRLELYRKKCPVRIK